MAEIKMATRQQMHNFRSFENETTFDADGDQTTAFDAVSYRVLGVAVQNLTCPDEIIVEGVLAFEVSSGDEIGDYVQILDADGLNPFTADGIHAVDVSPFAKVRVRKSGAAGSGVDVQISLSNYSR